MKKLYIDGRKAPRVHMHWRRFAIQEIPYEDSKALEAWVLERWIEKDELLEHFLRHGSFSANDGCTVAKVEIQSWLETIQIVGGVASVVAAWWIGKVLYGLVYNIMDGAW